MQRAAARADSATVEFDGNPQDILSSLARGVRPPPPTLQSQSVVVEAARD